MRIVETADCPPGTLLARSVVDARGRELMPAGAALTEGARSALLRNEVTTLIVEDEALADVDIRELAPSDLHAHLTAALFQAVRDLLGLVQDFRYAELRTIDAALRAPEFAAQILRSEGVRALDAAIADIVGEISGRSPIDGLLSLVMPLSGTHRTVDSGLLAAALARRIGLDHHRQRQALLGMLLRDFGMMFIAPATLDARGRLSAAATQRIHQHPTLSYLLARVIAPNDVFAQMVCFQHHERQDGAGYPRGLMGSNRLRRRARDAAAEATIVPEAEIASVVDVFMAVTAHRPYRAAIGSDAAMAIVETSAGSALNAKLVDVVVESVAWLPVLSQVRVQDGHHAGSAGVVVANPARHARRPRVRLRTDAAGRPLDPVDLDLSTGIEGLPVPPQADPADGKWAIADEVERIVTAQVESTAPAPA